MKTGCIILAGGKSSRMGEDKALLEYDGKQFIEKIAEELSFFNEKIIARGNNSDLKKIVDQGWKIISDIYPDHGPMGGLHAALEQCESDAMFVVTCDMPLITAGLAEKVCKELSDYDAVIVVTDEGKYHPLCGVYRKNIYEYMEKSLEKDCNRVMEVLKECYLKYVYLNADESRQLMNINTPEEYQKLNKI